MLHFSQLATILLMVAGLYVVIARGNMVKKLIGLSLFQSSVYLLYILPGKLIGGTAPILGAGYAVYANPLPHVLILTAIVVGIATLALGLTLVVRIKEAYGTIEEDEIITRDGPKDSSKGALKSARRSGRGGEAA
jgi:multicomponent Na+:H+ antiporter subunit C